MAQIASALSSDGPMEQGLLLDFSRKVLRPYLQKQPEPPPLSQVRDLWHRLVQSACSNEGNEKYLTAACNAVAVFLTTSSTSQCENLKEFAFSRQTWLDGYRCTQKAFEKGKTKPALQVLETLSRLLSEHSDKHAASTLLYATTKDLLNAILVVESPQQVKVSCITVSCFVKRTFLAPEIPRLTADCISELSSAWSKHLQPHNLNPSDFTCAARDRKAVFLALLMVARSLETRSAALKLLTFICTRTDEATDSQHLFTSAALTISLYVDRNGDLLGDFADNVFPVVLNDRLRWLSFRHFFQAKSWENESKLLQYLAVLRVGRLNKFITEEDLDKLFTPIGEANDNSLGLQTTGYEVFSHLLQASSSTVRAHTYNLLVVSHASSDTISSAVLQCIAKGLKYLHDDNDAHTRGEILSTSRRLLKRIDNAMPWTKLNATGHGPGTGSATTIEYREFLEKMFRFLLQELYSGISYPRHILALQTLQLFVSLVSSRSCDLEQLCMPLLSLTLDPFEDVRSTSIEICNSLFRLYKNQLPLLRGVAKQVEGLSATTCRHDHADAAGRLYALAHSIESSWFSSISSLERLDIYLSSATALLPGSTVPLHALLLGTTHYLSGLRPACNKSTITKKNNIFRVCRRVWELVRGELCVDSPETATADSVESSVGPKDLLAYSWRALRDSSLMLQATLQGYQINREVLNEAGLLCVEQLTMLRHRGAFSTVAQTFTLCCELARSSPDPSFKQLNEKWYLMAVEAIEKQAGKLTRRSAGLPALITSVLSPTDPEFFNMVLQDLKSKAMQPAALKQVNGQEVELSQVHALNCIKDIIHNSRFRTINERYLGELLKLGATSISSDVWAIRNSGLMLLKACMVRLESSGSTSNLDTSVHDAQSNREDPLQVVVNLLEKSGAIGSNPAAHINGVDDTVHSASSTPRSENIFAALDLVSYVGRASHESTRLNQLIRHHLKSQIWAIRDHAARVLVGRSEFEGRLLHPMSIYPLPPACSENELHGSLLFYRHCLRSQREHHNVDEVNGGLDALPDMLHILTAQVSIHSSPFTKAVLLDIVNDGLSFILSTGRILSDLDSQLLQLHRTCGLTHNAYCRARLLYGRSLVYLLNGSELADRKFIMIGDMALEALSHEICLHPDVAKDVLQRLQEVKPADAIAQMRLIDFLCRLSTDTTVADVRALSLTVLADVLEMHEQMATHFCGAEMNATRAAMEKALVPECTGDRDLWNASLRVWAFFIRGHLELHHTVPSVVMDSVFKSAKQLLNQIRIAGQDATECLTRLSAGTALRTCATQVISLRKRRGPRYTELAMKTLILLYDQLNDDDDEVRKLAEQSTASVLHRLNGRQAHQVQNPLCALASKETIIELMVKPAGQKTFEKQITISVLAIQRIMSTTDSQPTDMETSLEGTLADSVGDRLQRIYASMNDLFAEERQNLYIDDLDEVAKWSRILRQCGIHLTSNHLNLLVTWALKGMDQINMVVQGDDESISQALSPDHFASNFWLVTEQTPSLDGQAARQFSFGPTYNSEILILFVRVISLASVLVKLLDQRENEHQKNDLVTKLEEVKTTCVKCEADERLLMAFTVEPLSNEFDTLP